MPKKSERYMKFKFRRQSKGKAKKVFVSGKSGKHHCALCEKVMHGMPHGKNKGGIARLSKTERRPSALFAGVLCNQCRAIVVAEAAKVDAGVKKKDDVELRLIKFVEQVKVQ